MLSLERIIPEQKKKMDELPANLDGVNSCVTLGAVPGGLPRGESLLWLRVGLRGGAGERGCSESFNSKEISRSNKRNWRQSVPTSLTTSPFLSLSFLS